MLFPKLDGIRQTLRTADWWSSAATVNAISAWTNTTWNSTEIMEILCLDDWLSGGSFHTVAHLCIPWPFSAYSLPFSPFFKCFFQILEDIFFLSLLSFHISKYHRKLSRCFKYHNKQLLSSFVVEKQLISFSIWNFCLYISSQHLSIIRVSSSASTFNEKRKKKTHWNSRQHTEKKLRKQREIR